MVIGRNSRDWIHDIPPPKKGANSRHSMNNLVQVGCGAEVGKGGGIEVQAHVVEDLETEAKLAEQETKAELAEQRPSVEPAELKTTRAELKITRADLKTTRKS